MATRGARSPVAGEPTADPGGYPSGPAPGRAGGPGTAGRPGQPERRGRGLDVFPGGIVAASIALAVLIALPCVLFEPPSADLAAQTFRAGLWEREGWVLWSEAWYSGFLVPGYSVLYPPLGALLGPQLVATLSAGAAAGAFAALARRLAPGPASTLAALWLAVGIGALAYTGRITFLLGAALGLAALLPARRAAPAAALAAGAALATPLTGLFTALAGAALLLGGRPRRGLPIALGAGLALLAMVAAFPTGGAQPFDLSSLWATAIFLVVALTLPLWRGRPELRPVWVGLALYAALVAFAFLVPTPLGNNVSRLATLFAGPLAAFVLWPRHRMLLAAVALPLLAWQLWAPVRDVDKAHGDPSTEAAHYEPLLAELDRIAAAARGRPFRIELPPSENRWEADYVGSRYPLARGWMRQLEHDDVERLGEPLTPATYRRWLREHGVSFVALDDAPRDYLAAPEAGLLRAGLPYLREVWSDDHWTLWRVRGTGPPGGALATGGAQVTALGPDRFTVQVPGPGEYTLRLTYSPYMEVGGDACIARGGPGETRLIIPAGAAPGPRTIEVRARLSLSGLLRRDRTCGTG